VSTSAARLPRLPLPSPVAPALTRAPIPVPGPAGCPVLDVVVPVHDEEAGLGRSVRRLHAFLAEFPFPARITIADNASTDGTWRVARGLEHELPGVRAMRLEQKGRGRALRAAWRDSDAPVLAYMDVDLSTDLAGLLPLIAPLVSGHSDLAIGSRRARGSRVVRGPKRDVLSRGYNLLLRAILRTHFTDAQCGFKAIRADAARRLLPLIENDAWFFDTEMLVLAERAGMRIHEVPVDWVDDPDSRVAIASTVREDLRGIARIARGLASGRLPARLHAAVPGRPDPRLSRQLWRFAAVGVASTVAYVVLYLALRGGIGAQAANAVALLVTAVANTAANRRLTFGLRGAAGRLRQQAEGLGVFALGLAVTSGSLAALHLAQGRPPRALEVAVLVAANAAATLARFLLLRGWVFHPARLTALDEGPLA
jgi:putative flippase GtrA